MRRGEWRVTSQGIGFDLHGRLRDAHHRLNACIQSGVTFRSVVVLGMREDAYEVTDTGMVRTYADRLDEDRATRDASHRITMESPEAEAMMRESMPFWPTFS